MSETAMKNINEALTKGLEVAGLKDNPRTRANVLKETRSKLEAETAPSPMLTIYLQAIDQEITRLESESV